MKKRPSRNFVKAIPAVGKNQGPLNSVAEARRQIAVVKREFQGGKARFVAFTNLLSRAFEGERNPAVIALIGAERSRIGIRLAPKDIVAVKAADAGRALEQTTIHLKTLERRLGKGNFKNSGALVHILVSDTPKRDAGIAANKIASLAAEQELKFLEEKSGDAAFAETIAKLYSAAGELFNQRGLPNKAAEMFTAADIFKQRARHGI